MRSSDDTRAFGAFGGSEWTGVVHAAPVTATAASTARRGRTQCRGTDGPYRALRRQSLRPVGSDAVVRARLGVVLPLPAPAADEVDGLRRALGDRRIDAVAPHITLVPPVNVAPRDLDEALTRARDIAAAQAPLIVRIGPAATFWPQAPVVYLSVGADGDALDHLHDAFATRPWTRPTTWRFVPHVTIGQDVEPALIPGALRLLHAYRLDATLTVVRVLQEEPDGSWLALH